MKQAIIVIGLGFGDEGKGAAVDYLTRRHGASIVVRFNGGAQAAHNVVTQDGRWHTFSQFGSGTLIPGVRTHLSHHVIINPTSMLAENEHLVEIGVTDALERLTVSEGCLIATPYHRAVNRIKEYIRAAASAGTVHGSCGMGIGEVVNLARRTFSYAATGLEQSQPGVSLSAGDTYDHDRTLRELRNIRQACLREVSAFRSRPYLQDARLSPAGEQEMALLLDDDVLEMITAAYQTWAQRVHIVPNDHLKDLTGDTSIWEGAQGFLLDQTYGVKPYHTWSNTTAFDAMLMTEWLRCEQVSLVGCLRSYSTRHGQGIFPTEFLGNDPRDQRRLPEPHNSDETFQGPFRKGYFNGVLVQHALANAASNRPRRKFNEVILSHCDYIPALLPIHMFPGGHSRNGEKNVWTGQEGLYASRSFRDAEEYLSQILMEFKDQTVTLAYGPTAADRKEQYASKSLSYGG